MKRILLVYILLAFAFPPMFAQWKCVVKKGLDEGSNTRLFLEYTASSEAAKSFKVDIRFRPKGRFQDFMRKETLLKTKGDRIFVIPFRLNTGEYEVDVTVQDLDLGTMTDVPLDEIYKYRPQAIALSDIYLSYVPEPRMAFNQPLVDLSLEPGVPELYYFIELESRKVYDKLKISAFLFKDKNSQQDNNGFTKTYESVFETSKNVFLKSQQKVKLSDPLDVSSLDPGQYLLSIEVFDGATRLGAANTRFVIGGDLKQKILNKDYIDDAILMMEYILPLSEVENLLDNPDPKAKIVAFEKIWVDLYGEDAEAQMEDYYELIFMANDLFKEEEIGKEGWQTDRGKIFIQYGQPEKKELKIDGKEYERWIYTKWSLAFLFEKRNKGYYLIE